MLLRRDLDRSRFAMGKMIAHLVRSCHIVPTASERRGAKAKGFVKKAKPLSVARNSLVRRRNSVDRSVTSCQGHTHGQHAGAVRQRRSHGGFSNDFPAPHTDA